MKTPRNILFDKHGPARPKLDAVSRSVVAQLRSRQSSLLSALLALPPGFWREVIWPARRLWLGLAAVWLLILVTDLDFRLAAPRPATAVASAHAASFLMTFRATDQWLGEFPQPSTSEKLDPDRPSKPQPHPRAQLEDDIHLI